ncbi:MAG TPA: EamA family transporter [Candidatus Nanoarchaeia archaeon]|nr:EamA family transporter [Candidatus Nanoarchaeia archaeon]
MTTSIGSVIAVLVASVFGALAALLIKKGSAKFNFRIADQVANIPLLMGGTIYVLTTVVFIASLKYGELSVLYPLVATTYVWVELFSIKYLNESMNRRKWIGVGLIVVGVALIGMGK